VVSPHTALSTEETEVEPESKDEIEDDTESEDSFNIAGQEPESLAELVLHFMVSSTAFESLRRNLHNFVYPSFKTRLDDLVNKFLHVLPWHWLALPRVLWHP
jgi:hypothetical protein